MRILLLQDIPKTGHKGQVVEVSEGFGRHLVKQKQANFATPELVKKIEQQNAKEKEVTEAELKKIQDMAAKLDGEEIEIEASAKDGGFYAAVGANEIVKAIKSQTGVVVKPEQIKMKRAIKEAGRHAILVAFKHGLEAEVSVTVS